MALTITAATQARSPGQADQEYVFYIILDGAATTLTATYATLGLPAFSSSTGPAAGNTTAQVAAAKRVTFQNGLGGTSAVVRATKIIPTPAAEQTSVDITVSAVGTAAQTVQIIATVKDQAF